MEVIIINTIEIITRLFFSIIIGGLIGYEREFKNRPAGFRTHILVCIGAAVISMIQLYTVQQTTDMIIKNPQLASAMKADIGRLGAQVITGIGFLGAGTIIHEKGSVKGLTTAASIWVVACIGLAIGLGYYILSVLSTISVFVVLVILKKFEVKFIEGRSVINMEIVFKDKESAMNMLSYYFENNNVKIKNIELLVEDEEDSQLVTSLYSVVLPKNIKADRLIKDLCISNEILKVSIV